MKSTGTRGERTLVAWLGATLLVGGACGGGAGTSADGPASSPDARRIDGAAVDAGGPDATLRDGGPIDAAPRDAAPPRPDAAVPTAAGMLTWACTGDTCSAAAAVEYWRNTWGAQAVRRVVFLTEGAGGALEMRVTENDLTTPATLEFVVGRPVELRIVNRAGNLEPHSFTSPRLFRAVAWRHAESGAPGVPPGSLYRAPAFDAFQLAQSATADQVVTLRFIPWTAGSYDAFCETGVPNGTNYPDLGAGVVTPDLADVAGHAGRGMKATVTFTGDLAKTLDPGVSPARDSALDRDARRLDGDAAWLDANRVDVAFETHEYGINDYEYLPVNVNLVQSRGHRITVTNPVANLEDHYLTSLDLLPVGVFSRAEDDVVTVRAPYLPSVGVKSGSVVRYYWLALAAAGVYQTFCENGVTNYPAGHPSAGLPNLFTGHAGAGVDPHLGMKGTMTVAP